MMEVIKSSLRKNFSM
jgi:hypothetical protein